MTNNTRYFIFWVVSWITVVVIFISSRTLLPIDETRYTAVAWEMWNQHNFLVPHLNGAPYSHKPPLFFWMMQLGWAVFGVNDWWPRLIPALFALATLFLTHRFALRLWPEKPEVAKLAPTMVLGGLLWLQFVGMAMFDMILTFWVLLGIYAIYRASQVNNRMRYWILAGVATGLGLLSKGPVMLLHVLPVAVLAPLWVEKGSIRWVRWYAGVLSIVLIGALLILSWAIPAAIHGGEQYANAIFWGQTANRMVHSMAHREAWWFYFPLLPFILFPWFFWPSLWKSIFKTRFRNNKALIFCLSWILPVFISFVLISGKQPQYLLPLFAGFCLLSAYALLNTKSETNGKAQWLHTLLYIALGVLLLAAPHYQAQKHWPEWVANLSPLFGIALIIAGIIVLFPWKSTSIPLRASIIAASTMIASLTLNLIFSAYMSPQYDLRKVSEYIRHAQQNNIPVANLGKYHNQFHFYGRLTKSIAITQPDTVQEWIKQNPNGQVISYRKKKVAANKEQPQYQQPYRGVWVVIWSASQIQANPAIIK